MMKKRYSTLDQLRAELKKFESQEDALDFLYDTLYPLRIRVRCDASGLTDTDTGDSSEVGKKTSTTFSGGGTGVVGKETSTTGKKVSKEPATDSKEPATDSKEPATDSKEPATDSKEPAPASEKDISKLREISVAVKKGVLIIPDDSREEREVFAGNVEGSAKINRVILSYAATNSGIRSFICAECNGVVLDANTWDYLAIPPRELNHRTRNDVVDGYLAQNMYEIIRVNDATTVTLYCWAPPDKTQKKWHIASSNGYDVSSLKWIGEKTYAEILHELLSKHEKFVSQTGMKLVCEGGDTRLDFEALDESACYTVGFRHPNFHPLRCDPPGIWNIQAVNVKTQKQAPHLPGVPDQKVCTPDEVRKQCGIQGNYTPLEKEMLIELCKRSVEDAKAASMGKGPPKLNYGFILRSKDPARTGTYSDILISSPLLVMVRRLVYNRPRLEVWRALNHKNRLDYHALTAYLTPGLRQHFIELFPEFKEKYEIFKKFIDNVISQVIAIQRQNIMIPGKKKGDHPQTHTAIVAQSILTHILRREKNFKVTGPDVKSIVAGFVFQPSYALVYMRAIGIL